MFYRVRIDLAYPEDANPKAIQAHANTLFHDAMTINPGQPNEERGYIMLEKCYHDEDPPRPCEVISYDQTPLP
ncbi:hypothetical protein ES702_03787 [subsurface metagenome]